MLHTLCRVVEVGVRPRRRHGHRSQDPRVGDGPTFRPTRGRAPKRSADSSTTAGAMRWERLHTCMYRARRNSVKVMNLRFASGRCHAAHSCITYAAYPTAPTLPPSLFLQIMLNDIITFYTYSTIVVLLSTRFFPIKLYYQYLGRIKLLI